MNRYTVHFLTSRILQAILDDTRISTVKRFVHSQIITADCDCRKPEPDLYIDEVLQKPDVRFLQRAPF